MGVVWHKVWRDLTRNKARTALVVLSTAVGVFALGLVFGLYGVLRARIMGSYQASIPAHVVLWGGPFDRDAVEAVGRERDVAAVEGELGGSFRWKLAGEDEWRSGDITARDDFGAQRINRLRLQDGRWPDAPGTRALAVECLSSEFFDLPVGSAILVEFGERERRVPIEGIACAPVVLPPAWGGDATFFATPETVAWLSGSGRGDFDRLNVILTAYSEKGAEEAAGRIEERVERMGLAVGGYEVNDPDEFWIQGFVDGAMAVLAVMGVLSLGLSGFLIVNTMNAILVQQVWQIGVMKAVGGTLGRVMRVYLAMALMYGGMALLLAVPLSIVGAHWMALWLLAMFNVVSSAFRIQPAAVGIQLVVGVAVPLAAAAIPVIGGVGITVREAIGSHGLGSDFGQGWLDQLIGRVAAVRLGSRQGLPRPLALSLRNSFRRKARVALTLATLVFSGAMFVIVQSTAESLDNTVLQNFSLGEEVAVELERPRRISRAIGIAEGVPGVVAAEVWNRQDGTLLMPDGSEHRVGLTGLEPGSAIFDPNIVSGRSLRPGDDHALVFAFRLAEEEGLRVGDTVTLRLGDDVSRGEESEWTIVGLYLSIDSNSDEFFAPLGVVGRETGTDGRGKHVKTLVEGDDIPSQRRIAEGLKEAFAVNQIAVVDSWSVSEELVESRESFSILTSVLMVMVILAATVGSIGLMGTMSMNVVERTREIGVMRAIGASSLSIVGMFVVEGVLVGALSWLLAAPLSYPGSRLFSDLIGEILLEMPLDFKYSVNGLVFWLAIVSVLSALASLWPALRAARVSVREALAYE
ncbi:MAG: FtsX-like permease family protein [Anaerolineae bacterium]|nr:FtsX-like permease family protein [Anaerolineae bacterium]